ncbi:hypothetical protein [Hymenobacter edaphi]|uniref:Uncharacterized protein n=1 Tax=Hymenobacter edaphi TaxID=2211146 RepID=A0A328BHN2_9BACT|nr:hypothetical protein [Hymenobacter edaphi]RAK66972.1 hypothetical protein DLM85_12265 [Hymenobacter edaphi]
MLELLLAAFLQFNSFFVTPDLVHEGTAESTTTTTTTTTTTSADTGGTGWGEGQITTTASLGTGGTGWGEGQ